MPARLAVCAAVVALLAGGCGGGGSGGSPAGGIPVGQVVPDFALVDVNPASPTSGLPVSPRDALGSGSAWYFGHAT